MNQEERTSTTMQFPAGADIVVKCSLCGATLREITLPPEPATQEVDIGIELCTLCGGNNAIIHAQWTEGAQP